MWRATRIAQQGARVRRRRLEAELGTCVTHADQLDLLAILDRYPDAQTEELRSVLTDAMFAARPRRSLHAPRPDGRV